MVGNGTVLTPLPGEAVAHRSAGNTKENIRTPDFLCRKTAECPAHVDGRASALFFSIDSFAQDT